MAKVPSQRPPGLESLASDLTTIRNSVAPANIVLIPPRLAGPVGGFNPDARAAAASPSEWFGPDAQTIAADGPIASGPDRSGIDEPKGNGLVAVLSAAALAVVLSGIGLFAYLGTGRVDGPLVAGEASELTTVLQTTVLTTTVEPRAIPPGNIAPGGRLAAVIDRGILNCGVNGALPLFGVDNGDGTFSGFDIDFCRVVAAAVLGDADAVEYVPLPVESRFISLRSGDIDVLMRNTSQTATRAGVENVEFPFTTFYDGQSLMVREASGIESFDDLDGTTICVIAGTTTELNIEAAVEDRGLTTDFLKFEDNDRLIQAYESGACEGWTSDASFLAVFRLNLASPGEHIILAEQLSSEPLGPAVLAGDAEWSTAVEWAAMATVQAWEVGLDSKNIGTYQGNDIAAQTIAGQNGFDPGFGLQPSYPRLVVEQVGNYREIFESNFAGSGIALEGSANDLARNGGQLFAAPLR